MAEEATPESPTFGVLSMILGFLAFAGIIGHFFVGPIDPPPPVEVSIAEKAASIRDATVAALKGEDYEAERDTAPRTVDDYLTYSLVAVAVVAVLMAVIGFVRQERWRPGVAGAGFAGLAISFEVATMLFFGLLCAIVLAAVIDKLDFTS